MAVTLRVLACQEQSGFCSSDLVMLPAPGMAATSLGRLRSSSSSTTKASRLWMTLLAGVEDVDAARVDRSAEW